MSPIKEISISARTPVRASFQSFGELDVDYAAIAAPGGYAAMLHGGYDGENVNADIAPGRFPVGGEGAVRLEAALLGFDRSVSSKTVVKTAGSIDAERPWSVAGIAPLCAFGAKNPDEQRKHWIVGLGSVGQVGGRRYVPYLLRGGAERYLRLGGWGGDWRGYYRFLP